MDATKLHYKTATDMIKVKLSFFAELWVIHYRWSNHAKRFVQKTAILAHSDEDANRKFNTLIRRINERRVA